MKRSLGMIALLAGLVAVSGCSKEDSDAARRKLDEAGRELKVETRDAGKKLESAAHQAGQELRKDAHEASREIKQGAHKLKDDARSK